MNMYKPEGIHWEVKDLSVESLKKAMSTGEILEARVDKSDENLNLHLSLGDNIEGIIEYQDVEYSIHGKTIKSIAIMSKVGKTIKFKVKDIEEKDGKVTVKCSRAEVQKECYENFISKLTPGDIIQAHVTHIENYGIFCDIGCGIVALLPIENVSIIRITNPKKVLRSWKDLYVVVKSIDSDGKITLTHKELLGTWEEEASKFKVGQTVPGIVKTVEDYGVFIQISQNLSGLAEVDTMLNVEDNVSVYIKDINPETMKIKLVVVSSETLDPDYIRKVKFEYKQKHGHIDYWRYSPEEATKYVGTRFSTLAK